MKYYQKLMTKDWQGTIIAAAVVVWTYVVTIGRAIRRPNDFSEAHWLLDYRFGFMKRGLIGSICSLVTDALGLQMTPRLIGILSFITLCSMSIAMLCLLVRALRRQQDRTGILVLGLVFASSPFVVMSGHLLGYFDSLLYFLTIVAVTLVLRGHPMFAAILSSLAILTHESYLLIGLPLVFLATVEVLTANRDRNARSTLYIIAICIPVAVFLAASLLQSLTTDAMILRSQLAERLDSFHFVPTQSEGVARYQTTSFIEFFRQQYRAFPSRLLNPRILASVGPTFLTIFVFISRFYQIRTFSPFSVVVLGVVCASLAIHAIAWDTARISTYVIGNGFIAWWILAETRTAQQADRLFLLLAFITLILNVLGKIPLMDGEVERFSNSIRLLLYLPAIAFVGTATVQNLASAPLKVWRGAIWSLTKMNMKEFPRILITAIITMVVSIRLLPLAFDDAYIHFRIAENFVAHGAPYFNPGEAVMATSSPVWTCLLSILALTHIPLPLAVAILNSLLTASGAFLWSSVLQQTAGNDIQNILLLLFRFVYIGILLPPSVSLMETPLAMLLLGWASLLLIQSHPLAWSLIAVAVFTRFELIVFAVIAAIVQLTTTRKNVLRYTLFFFLPVTMFVLLLMFFFGVPIPQTILAKQVIYSLSRERVFNRVFFSLLPKPDFSIFGVGVVLQVQTLLDPLLGWAWMPGVFFVAGVVYSRLPFSIILSNKKHRWGVCIGATGVMIALAYIVKHALIFAWYVPLYSLPIVFFAFTVARVAKLTLIPIVFLSIIPLTTLYGYYAASMGAFYVLGISPYGVRAQQYIKVGSLLYEIFPDARLMTSEIGGLGISFRGVILDGVGLITPSALQYHPIRGSEHGIGGIPAAMIRDMKPELIVSYPVFLMDLEGTDVTEQYVHLTVSALPDEYSRLIRSDSIWGNKTLSLYIRKDIADDGKISRLIKELNATLVTE